MAAILTAFGAIAVRAVAFECPRAAAAFGAVAGSRTSVKQAGHLGGSFEK
jgi:hypothetical protein